MSYLYNKRNKMSTSTAYLEHYTWPRPSPVDMDPRTRYHMNFSPPFEGYQSLHNNYKIWHPLIGCRCLKFTKDVEFDIPTSIFEYHRRGEKIPGHPNYKLPSKIPQKQIWELYSVPKVFKYHPEQKELLQSEGKLEKYVPKVQNYQLRYRRSQVEIEDVVDDAEDAHVVSCK